MDEHFYLFFIFSDITAFVFSDGLTKGKKKKKPADQRSLFLDGGVNWGEAAAGNREMWNGSGWDRRFKAARLYKFWLDRSTQGFTQE